MKLKTDIQSISAADKAAFFDGFFAEFCKVPFGSMGKRDMECLLIKMLYDRSLIETAANRQAANALGINETRLKGYLADARYKYRADSLEANITRILAMLAGENGERLALNDEKDGTFTFVLEDPVLRLDLSQALKALGHYTDGSFNSELVRIKNYALLALLLKYGKADERLYKAIAERAGEHEKDLRAYPKKTTSPLAWTKKVFEYVTENHLELIGLVLNVALGLKKGV
jgi:hypothetical protein